MNGGEIETNFLVLDAEGLYALQLGLGNAETLMTGGFTINSGSPRGFVSEIVNAISPHWGCPRHDEWRLDHVHGDPP